MELTSVADQVFVAGAPAVASFQGFDSDGEPADPGTVTVSITSSAGTVIATDQATDGADQAPRTFDLTAADTAQVDRLTAVWKQSGTTIGTTVMYIVGRSTITFADYQLRELGKAITSTQFLKARREVDAIVFDRCKRSFVPRLAVERIWSEGTRTIDLQYPNLRDVRSATDENGDSIDVASVPPTGDSSLADLVSSTWPTGWIDITYVHGHNLPPDDVTGAIAKAISATSVESNGIVTTRINDQAVAGFTPRAGYGRAIFAIDEVDEVLNAHKWRRSVMV